MKNITVIGVGYVGLTTATCFADMGNNVCAVDISHERIDNLRKNIMPIYEPGLKEMAERNIRAGRLSFTTSYADGLKDAEYVFICVGTPEGVDGEADLQYVRAAAETIAKTMDHPLIVINKSTVPIGTGDWVSQLISENQPKPIKFSVVSCPEFLREGQRLRDFQNPDRTVLGSIDRDAATRRRAALFALARAHRRDGFAHRRNDQVRLERFPGDAHQLYQRDRQYLRGARRGCEGSRAGDGLR